MDEYKLYISPKEIQKTFNIPGPTLRRWAVANKVRCIRYSENGKRLYHSGDVERYIGVKRGDKPRKHILYARVSSNHQKEDLERQAETLKAKRPDAELITDIGSGLNFKRKGLHQILEEVAKGNIQSITILYRDRLCRFGFEIFEWIFKNYKTELFVVSDKHEEDEGNVPRTEQELAEDLLSVVNVFVARNNGLRAKRNKKIREEIHNAQDKDIPVQGTSEDSE